jgi:hypothetical protein
LVRVSRRADENHFVSVANAQTTRLQTSINTADSRQILALPKAGTDRIRKGAGVR